MQIQNLLENMSTAASPFQPFLENWTSEYMACKTEWNPASLKKDGFFYQFRATKACEIPILPDACFNILIECEGPNPSAFLCGIRPEKAFLKVQPDRLYFGFKPYNWLGIRSDRVQANNLVKTSCRMEDVFPSAEQLVEQMVSSGSFHERVSHMIHFAAAEMVDYNYNPNFIDYLAMAISVSRGNLEFTKLSSFTGYSTRYVRQRFKDLCGVSPKQYGQIMRFQWALKRLMEEDNQDMSHLALEAGYYDQALFIHAFKDYTAYTPMECLSMSKQRGNKSDGLKA
jgi:AraC-like DNA-binding protein